MKKVATILIIIFTTVTFCIKNSNAQDEDDYRGQVVLKGIVHEATKNVNESVIQIIRDGVKIGRVVTRKKGKFNLKLSLDHEYTLQFIQFGKKTKEVYINTNVGKDTFGQWDILFDILLEDSDSPKNENDNNLPFLSITYDETSDKFNIKSNYDNSDIQIAYRGKVIIKGKTYEGEKKVNESVIDIVRDGKKIGKEITRRNGKYNFSLSLDHEFLLRFTQFGKKTKVVYIDTNVGKDSYGQWEILFDIEIEDQQQATKKGEAETPFLSWIYDKSSDKFILKSKE